MHSKHANEEEEDEEEEGSSSANAKASVVNSKAVIPGERVTLEWDEWV